MEYLEIKYGITLGNNLSNTFYSLLSTGNIDEAQRIEKDIQIRLYQKISTDISHEWEKYIQYGNLPFSL